MLKNKAMLSIFIAVVFFAPFVASSDEPKENNAEETQVISLIDKMISNLQSGDIPRVMSTYADDAIVMFEPGVAVTDRKAIEQIFTEMAALKPEVTYSGHEVFIESPRDCRRLIFLRGLANEQTTRIFQRSARTRRAAGVNQRA